jgi:hypothetical protein
MGKIEYQILTINKMIALYCKLKHGNYTLCSECESLFLYANQKLLKCPFGDKKPECRDCKIHCYNAEMRQKMKIVMKFSGPRMIIYHPTDFFKHLINKK